MTIHVLNFGSTNKYEPHIHENIYRVPRNRVCQQTHTYIYIHKNMNTYISRVPTHTHTHSLKFDV
jgi:hypothetical protein